MAVFRQLTSLSTGRTPSPASAAPPRRLLQGAVLLGMCISAGLAGAAEHGVREVSPNHLKLSGGELSVGLNRDWRGPMPDVQRVLIIVHGRLRNAMTYLQSAETAASQAGQASNTLIIAPQFLNESDVRRNHLPDRLLRWHGNDWMAGEAAVGSASMSSYAALDEVLARLGNRKKFPALREVVIAGHSGGGQVVQRYALAGHGDEQLAGSGIRLRYVVANPSSYAYFSAQRPAPGFDPAGCPGFNDWKYGLMNLPAYATGQSPAQLEQAYVQRDVTYLLGQKDTNPNHPALDKSCAAEAQGAYRLVRGHNYFAYLQQRHPQGLAQKLVEVPGVGHDGNRMFTSPQGQNVLFSQ